MKEKLKKFFGLDYLKLMVFFFLFIIPILLMPGFFKVFWILIAYALIAYFYSCYLIHKFEDKIIRGTVSISELLLNAVLFFVVIFVVVVMLMISGWI